MMLAEQAELRQKAAEMAEALACVQATATDLRIGFDQVVAERDAWAQELFETNRHAAALTVERQVLLQRVAGLAASAELLAQARDENQELLAQARVENQGLRKRLDDVYASTSWKFARPIRVVRWLLLGRRR
jgi:chromosome segregation ATPase